jgi:hypothetical protein
MATATCSTRCEARHSQLDGIDWHFHRQSNDINPCTSFALAALHPPLPPRTHVLVQSKLLTAITTGVTPTASHSAAASPPNFKLIHCNRRRLPSLSARAASVSTTSTRRKMVQHVWSVRQLSMIQLQFYQAPPAAQQQPSTTALSLHAGPTSAASNISVACPYQPIQSRHCRHYNFGR